MWETSVMALWFFRSTVPGHSKKWCAYGPFRPTRPAHHDHKSCLRARTPSSKIVLEGRLHHALTDTRRVRRAKAMRTPDALEEEADLRLLIGSALRLD
ncbi:hypothetical protein EVG20_g7513 [Dentipellis fragilis]|uniref:Uncharacterized protein n=1 Tax=Dentipellis fragilis TaxID=205917 RepID=A0A4Y9YE80_9AGAM|nr:hypothetical protein EVG20_g7513 [Dentipellis fragilis]